MSSEYNSFSTTQTFGTRAFLESNSIVAKFAFLIMVLIGFVIILRFGTAILAYFLKPTSSPKLINGMVDATQMIVYPQDPAENGAITIQRSNDEKEGIEFTWSCWIFINNLQTKDKMYKHIFSKGNSDLGENGLIQPNNAPGLYIAPGTNALTVIMNTFDVINEEITIPNIPMNKWVNVIIRCKDTTLDVYINGTVARSLNLVSIPKQNYGDVFVAMNGGFNGYISNLQYFNYALGTTKIQNIMSVGPNTTMIGSAGLVNSLVDYMSLRWYFYGTGNTYSYHNEAVA